MKFERQLSDTKFYTKVSSPPPGRPIISANNCPMEIISEFVDHFLNGTKTTRQQPCLQKRTWQGWTCMDPSSMHTGTFWPKHPRLMRLNQLTQYVHRSKFLINTSPGSPSSQITLIISISVSSHPNVTGSSSGSPPFNMNILPII